MKIIKISQKEIFFNLEERKKIGDKVYKNHLLEYYEKYGNQSVDIDKKILHMMHEFKNKDWVISILYKKLYEKLKKSAIEYFSFNPQAFTTECLEELKNDKELVIAVFGKNPHYFNGHCPKSLRKDSDVLEGIKPEVIEYFRQHPYNFKSVCPEGLKHDKDVLQAIMPKLVEWLSKNQESFGSNCPEELKPEVQKLLGKKPLLYKKQDTYYNLRSCGNKGT